MIDIPPIAPFNPYDPIDPHFIRQWLEALESGDFVQVAHNLVAFTYRDGPAPVVGYCCMGVGVELDGRFKADPRNRCFYDKATETELHGSEFPLELVRRLGLRGPRGGRSPVDHLDDLNDNQHKSFEEIAEILRNDLTRSDPHFFLPEAAHAYNTTFSNSSNVSK